MLEDFVSVIDTLRGRIRDHREDLSRNELRTRVALIDPMLQALGWDVADPSQVAIEFTTRSGRADYALMPSSAAASSVNDTCGEAASSWLCIATDHIPRSQAVRAMRMAISPRLAISSFFMGGMTMSVGAYRPDRLMNKLPRPSIAAKSVGVLDVP